MLSLPSSVLCAPRTPSEHPALSAPPYRPRLPFRTVQEGLTCPIVRLPPCRSPYPEKVPRCNSGFFTRSSAFAIHMSGSAFPPFGFVMYRDSRIPFMVRPGRSRIRLYDSDACRSA